MGVIVVLLFVFQFFVFILSWNSWVVNIKEEVLEWVMKCNEFGDSFLGFDGEFNKRWGVNFYVLIVIDEVGCKMVMSDWLGVVVWIRVMDFMVSEMSLVMIKGEEVEELIIVGNIFVSIDQVSIMILLVGVVQMMGLGGVMMGIVVVGGVVVGGLF